MEPAMEAPLALVFEDVVFTIITTTAISAEDQEKLLDTLIENGANYRPTDPDTGRVRNLSDLTHIISTTCDFPEYDAATDGFKEVVTPQWVRDSEAKNKKCNSRQYSPDPRMFMSGVNVCCADIPEGDKNAIAGGVMAMGGLYSGPLTKVVTHVVALTTDNATVQIAQEKNLPCKIVLPHWFDDCLRLGRRLKEDPYELPDAAILKIGKLPPHSTSFSAIDGALTPTPSSLSIHSGPDEAPRELSVFKGMSFFLSEDLGLGSHLCNTLADLIKTGHGSLVDTVEEAEMVVCQFRDGKDYITASLNGLHVGNLAWLYHMIARDAWVSPMRRLLHYPVPRKGIEGFEHFTISLSNYQGAARIYIENLVKAAGAKYTKTMKNDNTHLIAAHSSGEKFTAASDWSIAVVNHLWLEDSYAKCKPQALTNPKYTHFPNRANLTDCVGQTEIDRDAIKSYLNAKPKKRSKEPQGPLPTPSTSSGVPNSSVLPLAATKNGENAKEPAPDPMDVVTEEEPPAPQTAKARRVSKEVKTATPARKENDTGKENDTPPTTGRAAKMKATNKLHDMATDITKFQSEMKRKGGVTHGGRRSNGDSTDERPRSASIEAPKERKKRTSDRMREVTPPEADTEDDPESPPAKKSRKGKRTSSGLPSITHRLLLTGDSRWKDNTKQHSADKEKLRALGIIETENPKEVTIVVVPRMLRTFKFVASIANGPLIVHTDWLDYTLKNKRMPDDNTPYLLNDEACEEQYGFELAPALERAKKNKKHLLRGWQIFVTDQVKGGPDTYINIVAANGGKCSRYAGRQGVTARKRAVDDHTDDNDGGDGTAASQESEDEDIVYLVSGSSAAEKKIWPKFRDMAKKEDMTARIAGIDWILHVCMAQEIKWDPEWELK